MKMVDVTMVRVYLAEGRGEVNKLVNWLQTDAGVRGFTVFRGVEGSGSHGKLHKATLIDLVAELPIVIEFFDSPERIEKVLEQVGNLVKPDHVVSWSAKSGS